MRTLLWVLLASWFLLWGLLAISNFQFEMSGFILGLLAVVIGVVIFLHMRKEQSVALIAIAMLSSIASACDPPPVVRVVPVVPVVAVADCAPAVRVVPLADCAVAPAVRVRVVERVRVRTRIFTGERRPVRRLLGFPLRLFGPRGGC